MLVSFEAKRSGPMNAVFRALPVLPVEGHFVFFFTVCAAPGKQELIGLVGASPGTRRFVYPGWFRLVKQTGYSSPSPTAATRKGVSMTTAFILRENAVTTRL